MIGERPGPAASLGLCCSRWCSPRRHAALPRRCWMRRHRPRGRMPPAAPRAAAARVPWRLLMRAPPVPLWPRHRRASPRDQDRPGAGGARLGAGWSGEQRAQQRGRLQLRAAGCSSAPGAAARAGAAAFARQEQQRHGRRAPCRQPRPGPRSPSHAARITPRSPAPSSAEETHAAAHAAKQQPAIAPGAPGRLLVAGEAGDGPRLQASPGPPGKREDAVPPATPSDSPTARPPRCRR